MKRFRIKIVRGTFVLHVRQKVNDRKVWRRLWGYQFITESQARTFAEGNF